MPKKPYPGGTRGRFKAAEEAVDAGRNTRKNKAAQNNALGQLLNARGQNNTPKIREVHDDAPLQKSRTYADKPAPGHHTRDQEHRKNPAPHRHPRRSPPNNRPGQVRTYTIPSGPEHPKYEADPNDSNTDGQQRTHKDTPTTSQQESCSGLDERGAGDRLVAGVLP